MGCSIATFSGWLTVRSWPFPAAHSTGVGEYTMAESYRKRSVPLIHHPLNHTHAATHFGGNLTYAFTLAPGFEDGAFGLG